MMFSFFKIVPSPKPRYRRIETAQRNNFLITKGCIDAIYNSIQNEKRKNHEGVVYIYGRTDGFSTIAVGAIKPKATTTPGSFYVSTEEMARIVKVIRRNGLQLICQLHTHPGQAYHSDGDIEGLKLICDGYVSIVIPDYGLHLPSFKGAAFYFFRKNEGFVELERNQINIIPKRLP